MEPQASAGSKTRRWARKAPPEVAAATASPAAASFPPQQVGDREAPAGEQQPRLGRLPPQQLTFPLDPVRDAAGLGAGDSFLVAHFLVPEEADAAFQALLPLELGGAGEVPWVQMYGKDGRPFARLKCTQAEPDPAAVPIYRYPTNNQQACASEAWSETVGQLRDRVAALCRQGINHCVGNLYRSEQDFIGPHKDKMLDILTGSAIASLSLGAERPMVLDHEDGERQQVVPLRHGSLFIIGPETNLHWTHSIPKHVTRCGPRISLTLRQMGTFLDTGTGSIRGQGAAWTSNSGLPKTLPLSSYQDPNWPLWTHDLSITPTVAFPRRRLLDRELAAHFAEGGSTFDCLLVPCEEVAEVRRIQQRLRAEHPDACHVPCAWLLRRQRPQPGQAPAARRQAAPSSSSGAASRFRGWDADGEPVVTRGGGAGGEGWPETVDTAHDGLFAVLEEAQVADCAAFVVRRWDGQRLGLARLVGAYAAAVRLALEGLQPQGAQAREGPAAAAAAEPPPPPWPSEREGGGSQRQPERRGWHKSPAAKPAARP